jgi:hypothetical protein
MRFYAVSAPVSLISGRKSTLIMPGVLPAKTGSRPTQSASRAVPVKATP